MKVYPNELTKEMLERAMQCETAYELMRLANGNGFEMTYHEAEAYLAEMQDFELDDESLKRVAGGGCYTDGTCTSFSVH